ncbi:gamma-glutamylcyclotransferase family protein [Halomonas sp. E19]|uniref:gamma-glutamylcyclotransferase family protein n=1 Tax=Halomonas sp. E19 TaxID=3397247 RepID=UPI0040339AEE
MRPRPRDIVLSLLVLLLGALSWLWLTMLSPFTYDRPAHLPEVDEGPHAVFVYGTLRLAPVRWLVMGRAGETEPAVLAGFRRDGLDLVEAPGSEPQVSWSSCLPKNSSSWIATSDWAFATSACPAARRWSHRLGLSPLERRRGSRR